MDEAPARQIVVDTETTGLDPAAGDRVVEIGCVELVKGVRTGRTFHSYVNPRRDVPREAVAIHGLEAEFLSGMPGFEAVADGFLDFVGDAGLVIHNAAFDLSFLDAELAGAGRPPLSGRHHVVDTLEVARGRYPQQANSLDALCRRFGIDLSGRKLHGALLDSTLLADVYLELSGGREPEMDLGAPAAGDRAREDADGGAGVRVREPLAPRPHAPSADEAAAHEAFVGSLESPLWLARGPAGEARA